MKFLLALDFASLLTVPALAQEQGDVSVTLPQQGGVHLALEFGRGPNYGAMSDTAVAISMQSLEACEKAGNAAINQHKKLINTLFLCIEGTR